VAEPGYQVCNLNWVKGRRFAMKRYSNWCCLIIVLTLSFLIGSLVAGDGWAKEPWEGKITYTKTPPGVEGPALAYDSYIAVALQSTIYGCRNKEDVQRNLDNVCRLIDESMFIGTMEGEVKLVALTEGALQGMYDEMTDMDQATYCKEVAITIPGPEVDRLAEKAKQHKIYLAVQAKVKEPELMPDRYFNQAFIISPDGEIVLRHVKNLTGLIEGTTTPYDVWDVWAEKVGSNLEACYPVVKTEIGNLAVGICYETTFPETFRAFTLMGAEVIIKIAFGEPSIMDGTWEVINRARAIDSICYIVAPNLGPYFYTPDVKEALSLGGGNSMIVNYKGHIIRKAAHPSRAYVTGEINIKGLRKYRAHSGRGSQPCYMRSGLWKEIYERWPEYPKNLYLEKPINRAEDRIKTLTEVRKKFFDAGIYTAP
jgi:predicted amidohydrolase